MELKEEYLALGAGDPMTAAVCMTLDLMRDDPETFKVGYTIENASWAAADLFGLDREEVAVKTRAAVQSVWLEIRAAQIETTIEGGE